MNTGLSLKKRYLSPLFNELYTYPDNDLGVNCTYNKTTFKLWSPLAKNIKLHLLKSENETETFQMKKALYGVWEYKIPKSLHGTYYYYTIDFGQGEIKTGDPYAKACGLNSRYCMAVNLADTNPMDWDKDKAPPKPNENIIYELHIKEFSWQNGAGFPDSARGKYNAFLYNNTSLNSEEKYPTGINYLKNLGVTHIQLMPAYDYASVDDTKVSDFNWGYDPLYYNVPEGSYSSNSSQADCRIKEFKEMIKSLHSNGFRVIMDVVYNHTHTTDNAFNKTVPWYYYRLDKSGELSNGSGCGNDFATEMPMCRKFIIDSVLYWASEYHIDGFRFDLMGLIDIDLMNTLRIKLDALYGVGEKIIFGEPWSADKTHMAYNAIPALKENIKLLDENIGMFSDDTRDSIKGNVFKDNILGFVTHAENVEKDIMHSVKAWCDTDMEIKSPSQIITYVSAHDNHTLWDKLGKTYPDTSECIRINKLTAAIYMTCQGNLFMLSGEEFGRTKNNLDNTYNESIELNQLDWKRTVEFSDMIKYYHGLITLRKICPGLYDKSEKAKERVSEHIISKGFVSYYLDNSGKGSLWDTLCIAYNASNESFKIPLSSGSWQLLINGTSSSLWYDRRIIASEYITIPSQSAIVLGKIK